MLLLGSLAPWTAVGRLAEVVEVMSTIGFEEIVMFWPWNDDEQTVFDHDAGQVTTLAG